MRGEPALVLFGTNRRSSSPRRGNRHRAEGEGFEPSSDPEARNGFRDERDSAQPSRSQTPRATLCASKKPRGSRAPAQGAANRCRDLGVSSIGAASVSTLLKDLRRRFTEQGDWHLDRQNYTIEDVANRLRGPAIAGAQAFEAPRAGSSPRRPLFQELVDPLPHHASRDTPTRRSRASGSDMEV